MISELVKELKLFARKSEKLGMWFDERIFREAADNIEKAGGSKYGAIG